MTRKNNQARRSVAAVIFNEERSEVLLIKRRDVNIWAIPGGGVDPGEEPEAAILREIHEETGLTARIERQVAYYTPINRLANDTYLFECTIVKGKPKITDETQGIDFFPLTCLPEPIFFLHKDWIDEAAGQVSGVIQKPLSQITYFNLFKYFLLHPIQVLRLLLSRLGIPYNS